MLEIVYHDYPLAASQAEVDANEAAACEDFTTDHQVFAVISESNGHSESYKACLLKRRTVFVGDYGDLFDDVQLSNLPNVLPPGFSLTREHSIVVDALFETGYFDPWDTQNAAPAPRCTTKIGLIYTDQPLWRRTNAHLDSALALHDLEIDPQAKFGIRPGNDALAQIQNAVLRFPTEGVDHVLFNTGGSAFAIFALYASQQQYYPRCAQP